MLALTIAVLSLTNSTEIEVNHQELTILHGPLPSIERNRTVPVRDINQLFLKRIKISGNLSGMNRDWELRMVDRSGTEKKLIGAIPDWNQAQLIEQEIERFLSRVRSEEKEASTLPQGNADPPVQGLRPDLAALEELDIPREEPPCEEQPEETDV